jgi:hypothetical protein
MRYTLFLLLVILSGCCQNHLSVQTQYVTHEMLASYHVGTPDPNLACPTIGQRLLVNWRIPDEWIQHDDTHLEIFLRYRNRQEGRMSYPLRECRGLYIVNVLNEEYCKTQGILSYKIDLIVDGEIVEEWRHQLWAELIHFKQEATGEL